jgi:hypothetical protein
MFADPIITDVPTPLMEALLAAPMIAVDPAQTNILDQIADLEADQIDEDIRYAEAEEESLLAVQYPVTEEEAFTPTDELLEYTDPLGVTFEAPVVEEKEHVSLDQVVRWLNEDQPATIEEEFTKEEIEEVEEARALYENNEESLTVSDPKVISVLQNEVNNIFGYDVEIEIYEDGENYNIVTNDGQEVVVPIDYVNNLI